MDATKHSMEQVCDGVRRFQATVFPQMQQLYESLAEKQKPHTLFLTCGDSRIEPSLLTGTEPGQIFVERNPGNIVPIYDGNVGVGVSASIEYAVAVLGVENIIVCGHSSCGAMKALLEPNRLDAMPATAHWLAYAQRAVELLNQDHSRSNRRHRLRRLTELNILEQIAHLHSHPAVEEQLGRGVLEIYGWYYEIHSGTVETFDPQKNEFSRWPGDDRDAQCGNDSTQVLDNTLFS